MKIVKIFTATEIANWNSYERVRQGGAFNMFDPNARLISGLSRSAYAFCMENYTKLKDASEAEIK